MAKKQNNFKERLFNKELLLGTILSLTSPEMGSRSVGLSRANGFGGCFQKYVKEANRNTLGS